MTCVRAGVAALLLACGNPKPLGEMEQAVLAQLQQAMAQADYDRVVRLSDELLRKTESPTLRLYKGTALLRAGRAHEAARVLEAAQAMDPASPVIAAARVRAYLAEGKADRAKAAIELARVGALESDGLVAAVRAGAGDVEKTADALLRAGQLALRARRNDEAMSAFAEAVALAPKAAPARLLLGSALYNLNLHAAAVAQLTEAAKLDGRLIGAWKLLGHCHSQMGDGGKAAEAYRHVLALAPSDIDAQAALAKIEGRPPQAIPGASTPPALAQPPTVPAPVAAFPSKENP